VNPSHEHLSISCCHSGPCPPLSRIIAVFETPDTGSIHFSGAETTDVHVHIHVRVRNVGFVFQHCALFRNMSLCASARSGRPALHTGHGPLIEAQIPAQQFRELGFEEGETLVVLPRKARVFLRPEAVSP
jgi:ABC-type molybdate transport system ATPase subunit